MYITVGKAQVCVDDTLVYLCEDIVDQSVADRFCYSNQSMHCLCCVLGMIIIVQLILLSWDTLGTPIYQKFQLSEVFNIVNSFQSRSVLYLTEHPHFDKPFVRIKQLISLACLAAPAFSMKNWKLILLHAVLSV